jgi:Flp pilus assembly protein TadG
MIRVAPRLERAQALIEFAFVAPIFILFLLGIVDFGIALDRRLVLQHAVREGARYGAVNSNLADVQGTTVDQAQDLIDAADVTVCYEDKVGGSHPGNPGDAVEVTATLTYEFPIMTEIFGVFGVDPLSIEMSPHSTARLEQTVPGAAEC